MLTLGLISTWVMYGPAYAHRNGKFSDGAKVGIALSCNIIVIGLMLLVDLCFRN